MKKISEASKTKKPKREIHDDLAINETDLGNSNQPAAKKERSKSDPKSRKRLQADIPKKEESLQHEDSNSSGDVPLKPVKKKTVAQTAPEFNPPVSNSKNPHGVFVSLKRRPAAQAAEQEDKPKLQKKDDDKTAPAPK